MEFVSLHRARTFSFSPEWDGETVVYDRRAGDLWVISASGRKIIELLADWGPVPAGEVEELGRKLGFEAGEFSRLLDELAGQGIVERTHP